MFRKWILSIALLAVGAGCCLADGEQWLGYQYAKPGWENGNRGIMVSRTVPEIELPRINTDAVYYGSVTMPRAKDGKLWAAFVKSKSGGIYDVVFLDQNANGSLKDDKPIKAYEIQENQAQFGPLPVFLPGEDGPVTYHIGFMVFTSKSPGGVSRLLSRGVEHVSVMVQSAGWYEGDITIDGKKQLIKLMDRNVNGDFNDVGSDYGGADAFTISGEKPVTLGASEQKWIGGYFEYGRKFYKLEVANDGAFIKVAQDPRVKLGTVNASCGMRPCTVFLTGKMGSFLVKPGVLEQVPQGSYKIQYWLLETKNKGQVWKMRGQNVKSQKTVLVGDQPLALIVGHPVKVSLECTGTEGKYNFSQKMVGALGEDIEILNQGSRPDIKLQITSADGKYEKKFSFEYG